LYFNNVNTRTHHRWDWDYVAVDLDGTLTDSPSGGVVVYNDNITLFDPSCKADSRFSNAVVCSNKNTRIRVAYGVPPSFYGSDSTITNSLNFSANAHAQCFRLTIAGAMFDLEANQVYTVTHYVPSKTTADKLAYNGAFFGMKPGEFLIIQHPVSGRKPDKFYLLNGKLSNESTSPLSPLSNNNGDWYWDSDNNVINYILLNKNTSPLMDHVVNVSFVICQFAGCTTPAATPTNLTTFNTRPANALFWSNLTTWSTIAQPGWGGYLGNNSYGLPRDNDSVLIPLGKYVVVDCSLPKLTNLQIDGTLEFDNGKDHYLEANVKYFIILNI